MHQFCKRNQCDGCGTIFLNEEHVIVLIEAQVELLKTNNDLLRVKLSKDAVDTRTIKIYCNKCLNQALFRGNK